MLFSTAIRNKELKQHIEIFNSLALLLVTGSRGDVAAVSIDIRPRAIKVFVAKNRELNVKESMFLSQLTGLLKQRAQGEDTLLQIRECIIDNCKPKILSRLNKLQEVIDRDNGKCKLPKTANTIDLEEADLAKIDAILRDSRIQALLGEEPGLRERAEDRIRAYWTLAHQNLLENGTRRSNSQLRSLITLSYLLGSDDLEPLLGRAVLHRLKKLGDYYTSTQIMIFYADDRHFKAAMQDIEIISPVVREPPSRQCNPLAGLVRTFPDQFVLPTVITIRKLKLYYGEPERLTFVT
ncbi:hypothetical protein ABW21_db0203257 [Orbilia brochopaga]|nr:hypothetical protein ABW21_db0203257 [Drechslerella brochopaga]